MADSEYLAGADYTIADIAVFPWYGGLAKGWAYGAAEFLSVQDYKNVQRWADAVFERPAVKRGRMVNRTSGEPSGQLRERHEASDFDTRTAGQAHCSRSMNTAGKRVLVTGGSVRLLANPIALPTT